MLSVSNVDKILIFLGRTSNYIWKDLSIESIRQAFLNGLSTGLKNPQKGKTLIITHIGSVDGFLEDGEWIFEAKKIMVITTGKWIHIILKNGKF